MKKGMSREVNPCNASLFRLSFPTLRTSRGIQSAKIVVKELSSGRTIFQVPLSLEKKEIKVDISLLASGVYGYSLEADGILVQTRKLVVVK
jgi:hypothetical protein